MTQVERLFEKYKKDTKLYSDCPPLEYLDIYQFQHALEEALKEQREACWQELVNDMECGISDWNIFKNTILNAKVSE